MVSPLCYRQGADTTLGEITPERRNATIAFNGNTTAGPTRSCFPRQKVLLVDEDSKDLLYFTRLLECMSYSVRAFRNYREAVGCLEHGNFDLVIVSEGGAASERHYLVDFTTGRERYTPLVVLTSCLHTRRHFKTMQLGCRVSRKACDAGGVRTCGHDALQVTAA